MLRVCRTVVFLFLIVAFSGQTWALQRAVPPAHSLDYLQTAAPTGRIVVKFAEDSGLRMTRAGLVAAQDAMATRLRIAALLQAVAPQSTVEKHFPQPALQIDALRLAAEARDGRGLPDLNRYAHFDAGTQDRTTLIAIVKQLAADPAIETVFLEPVAVPAALGFDAFTGATPVIPLPSESPNGAKTTPDFESQQGYLQDAPLGVGALSMRSQAGARGAGVQIIDVEGAWLWTHEDLPAPFAEIGGQIDNLGWRNHGTAVMGEMRGTDNGYGVSGIVPDCTVGNSSIAENPTSGAIVEATLAMDPGGLILIELHAPGPNANGSGQYGYVPMEFWQDNFDAMQLATASGMIVCEAAGNGAQDLDEPVYQGLFDRQVRDSGAIMCGATNGSSLEPAGFTNHGSRVDLHGWGYDVVTCGYGGLQGEPLPEEEWYTSGFSGTSSASPIVTGSVAGLQGMVRAEYGFDLDARLARDILRQTGTPQEGTAQIGPRPDLVAAWALASTGIGELIGTVTDLDSGMPIENMQVTVEQTGAFDITDATGGFRFALVAGTYDLTFTSFFYGTEERTTTITNNNSTVLDVVLESLPVGPIVGMVYTLNTPQPDVRVFTIAVPLPSVTTDQNGEFSIPGAPWPPPLPLEYYSLQAEGIPGYGALVQDYVIINIPDKSANFRPNLPPITEDFEAGNGGFTSDNGLWQYGAPHPDGPGTAFSGDNCWGVGNGGGYEDDANDLLRSPVYDLTSVESDSYFLSFHYWSQTELNFDGANLWDNQGGDYVLLQPLAGYTDIILGGLDHQPGWSGHSETWRGAVFDVSFAIGDELEFYLEFGSDGGLTDLGFWIDGITLFNYEDISTDVEDPDLPSTPLTATLTAFPNPFNPVTTIAWEIPEPGPLALEVFDLRGRLISTLLDARVESTTGTVTWQARSDAGRPVASGVYLVRLQISDEPPVTQRIVLSK